jgi:RNA polymerase sigma factor (TIGR02999 family)
MSRFTELLTASEAADPQATADLFALVYDELKQLAARRLAQEYPGNTLQPTALVHEVYLRLLGDAPESGTPRWQCRRHFMAAAAEAMRRILVETARRKSRHKHGGGRQRVSLNPEQIVAQPELADHLLALDKALAAFAAIEPQIAELVKLRFFGGLTLKEAATALEMAPRTADANWAYARSWLLTEIRRIEDSSE